MAKETFVARVYRRGEVDQQTAPAASTAIAMQRSDAACKRGSRVVIRGEYTSDGTYWPRHHGRVTASCEGRQWLLESNSGALRGRRRRRKRRS